MGIITEKIISLFLILVIGFIAAKKNIISEEGNKYLTELLLKIICPCMIITAITSSDFTSDTINNTIIAVLVSVFFYVGTFVFGYLVCKYIFRFSDNSLVLRMSTVFSSINNGFMGFPITLAIFGKDVLYYMVISNTVMNLYLFSIMPVMYSMEKKEGHGFDAKSLLASLTNINTIAAVIGIIMLFSGIHFPEMIFQSLDTVGSATVPLSLIIIGAQLGRYNLKDIFMQKEVVMTSIVKMATIPILTFLTLNWMPIHSYIKAALIFAACFPCAVVAAPIADSCGFDGTPIAKCIAFTTIISIITIPAAAIFLTGFYF